MLLAVGVVLSVALAGPVGASAMPPVRSATTTTYAFAPGGIPSMLPKPNTGTAPRDADDPGGWGQYAVFYGILASGVIIFGLVFFESRRKLRAIREADGAAAAAGASRQPVAASTRSEPVADTSEKRPESSARQ
jgi:hypothetical protein